jgi:hypothetical protein
MRELLFPYGFDTLEYSWVKPTIAIYMFVDYSMLKNTNINLPLFYDGIVACDTMNSCAPHMEDVYGDIVLD